ncbi:MAG: GNAT family N-acetyltransferase [Thermoplasmatota archaeon]
MFLSTASMEDAEAIARNNVQLRMETEHVEMDSQVAIEGTRALIASEERGFYLVARHDGEIVGQVLVTHEWSDWRNRDIWWLHRIYVKQAWRHSGILKKLFAEVHRRAMKNNVYAVRLYLHEANREAAAIYRKLGMKRAPFHVFSTTI